MVFPRFSCDLSLPRGRENRRNCGDTLQYTPAHVGEVTTATIATTPTQPTSPIGFLFLKLPPLPCVILCLLLVWVCCIMSNRQLPKVAQVDKLTKEHANFCACWNIVGKQIIQHRNFRILRLSHLHNFHGPSPSVLCRSCEGSGARQTYAAPAKAKRHSLNSPSLPRCNSFESFTPSLDA